METGSQPPEEISRPQIAKRERKPRSSLLKRPVTLRMALLVLLGIAAFRLWVVETAIVDGRSMQKALEPDDRVLVLKPMGIGRFNVVVMKDPQAGGVVIKRVVGIAGDTIAMVPRIIVIEGQERRFGSQLFVNGVPYDEPYAISRVPVRLRPFKVPERSYFVLGDNRDESIDSRHYGPVGKRLVHGVGVAVVYPFGRARLLRKTAAPVASAPAGTSR